MSKTLELTQALIARQSVSPADGGCQALIFGRNTAVAVRSFALPATPTWFLQGPWMNGAPILLNPLSGMDFCMAGARPI
jgi:hypothetical protein